MAAIDGLFAHAVSPVPPFSSREHLYGFGTRAIHVGSEPNEETGAVIPPISLSTTFRQERVGVHKGVEYSRADNPNRHALEAQLASLEGGAQALAFASGSAATATVLTALGANAHVVSVNDVYGGTHRYMTRVAKELQNVKVTFIDLENANEDEIVAAITPETKIIWIESPTNPTLRLIDIPYVARIASAHPAKPLLLVDNTFLSPYYQSPLKLGADIVLHSLTKYVNGHSDVVMGALILADITPTSKPYLEEISSKLRFLQNAIGAIPSPHDSWLVQRGAKTLHLRMRQHGLGALAVAGALERAIKRGLVKSVTYPGLPSHPRFGIAWHIDMSEQAKKWVESLRGSRVPALGATEADSDRPYQPEVDGVPFGGMVSFRINGGERETNRFLVHLKLFALAESLGGVESLAEVPDRMTHGGIPAAEKAVLGIGPDLIRLSVGIEEPEDLVHDIEAALEWAVLDESGSERSVQLSIPLDDDSPLTSQPESVATSEFGEVVAPKLE